MTIRDARPADATRSTPNDGPALRRMRLVAVGLLVLAAVVFLLTLGRGGFWGFVNAGAEASMVGAIADWFAVTALFRHPLGIPVPHTALIPRRKEMLGRSLEDFVAENFLHEEAIRERVAASGVTRRVGEWLAVEANARRVVLEAGDLVRAALARIADDDVAAIVTRGARAPARQRAPCPGGGWPPRRGRGGRRSPRCGGPAPARGTPLARRRTRPSSSTSCPSERPGGHPGRCATPSPAGSTASS